MAPYITSSSEVTPPFANLKEKKNTNSHSFRVRVCINVKLNKNMILLIVTEMCYKKESIITFSIFF